MAMEVTSHHLGLRTSHPAGHLLPLYGCGIRILTEKFIVVHGCPTSEVSKHLLELAALLTELEFLQSQVLYSNWVPVELMS